MKGSIRQVLLYSSASLCTLLCVFSCGRRGSPIYPQKLVLPVIKRPLVKVRSDGVYMRVGKPTARDVEKIIITVSKGKRLSISDIEALPLWVKVSQTPLSIIEGEIRVFFTFHMEGARLKLKYPLDLTPPECNIKKVETFSTGNVVELTWEKGDKGAYNIYRIDISSLEPLNSYPLDKGYFADTVVKKGEEYTYIFRAVNSKGDVQVESDVCKTVVAPNVPPPPPPPNVVYRVKKGNEVEVLWTPVRSEEIKAYRVYVKCGRRERRFLSQVPASKLSFSVKARAGCKYGISSKGEFSESIIRWEVEK